MAKDNVLTQKTTNHESQIKKSIMLFVGSKVEIKIKSGRNKAPILGILENACTSVFIVRYINAYGISRSLSFRYAEILIGEIEAAIWIDGLKMKVEDVHPVLSKYNNQNELLFDGVLQEDGQENEQENKTLVCC